MKSLLLILAVFALVAANALPAADMFTSPRVEVIFDHPENFTDIKDNPVPTERSRETLLGQIRSYLAFEAQKYVPEGCKLTLIFTDIDLAGVFRPWQDLRVMQGGFPPAAKFTWKVANAAGAVIKQGREAIRDLDAQRLSLDTNDELRFDKALLDLWMRGQLSDLGRLVAAK